MRIEVDKIAGMGGGFAHAYAPEEIALDDEYARLTSPPEIRARIKRHGERVELRGHLSARTEVDCDRCLKTINLPVETNFEAVYLPAASIGSNSDDDAVEEAELQIEDLNVSTFDGETIDVDELVREQILLALPVRALCAEDCQGLCPACGADKNIDTSCNCAQTEIDPRWAALKDLQF